MAGLKEYYDARDTAPREVRERGLMARLPALVARAMTAPGWAQHLAGVDPAAVTGRDALARLPVLRKADMPALQAARPPLGGFNATALGDLKRLLVSPGPIYEPEGKAADWWGAARGLFAAGMRHGDVVINCFSYHLTPGGHIMESGAAALGCCVIPGGVGNTEQQVDAVAALRPAGYLGTPDFLKVLLDRAAEAGRDASSIRRGVVSGAAFPPSLQRELSARGVEAMQAYATAELGFVAFETPAREGLVVNEDRIVEIVKPGTGEPVAEGEVGEVVVTCFNDDYPMIRLATGDLSAVLAGESPCGRTALRIKGWMGRADQTTKVKGMFVHPAQVAEVGRRHPELGRLRLVVRRAAEQDVMVLHAESRAADHALADAAAATLQSVTKLRGTVQLVEPGALPNDGKVIADERPVA